jgi:nucleotide-binding universal stress UspA family protein
VQTSSHILYGTDVPQSVVTHAGTLGAEVIVLGVRRKPGLSTHLPPQRTYRIIMTAPCPVLTLSCEQKTPIAFASGSS